MQAISHHVGDPVIDIARSHLGAKIEGSAHGALNAAIPESRFGRASLQITGHGHYYLSLVDAMCCFFSKEHAAAMGRAQARALAETLKLPKKKDPPEDGRFYEAPFFHTQRRPTYVVGPRPAFASSSTTRPCCPGQLANALAYARK
jgi:hypothetical protein